MIGKSRTKYKNNYSVLCLLNCSREHYYGLNVLVTHFTRSIETKLIPNVILKFKFYLFKQYYLYVRIYNH